MTNALASLAVSRSPTTRATTSVAPPAGKGTTIVTGRAGYGWADARSGRAMMAITISANQPRRAFMVQTSSVGGAQQNRRTDPTRTDRLLITHGLTGSQGGAKPAPCGAPPVQHERHWT